MAVFRNSFSHGILQNTCIVCSASYKFSATAWVICILRLVALTLALLAKGAAFGAMVAGVCRTTQECTLLYDMRSDYRKEYNMI